MQPNYVIVPRENLTYSENPLKIITREDYYMLRMVPLPSTLQTPTPPIQALDMIDFEKKLKKSKLVSLEKPDNMPDAIKKVKKREKINIMATNTLSSLGLGLGCTIGILLKFVAPLAFGGAAFVIAAPVMISLTCGAGLLALGLAFLVHKFGTKKAIEDIATTIYQNKLCKAKMREEGEVLTKKIEESFTMLLTMKLALERLKRAREKVYPNSIPATTERKLEACINEYINFLVHDPNHPNVKLIEDIHDREKEIQLITDRQKNIRRKLNEACTLILNHTTTIKDYVETKDNAKEIIDCYPSLHLVAHKATVPPIISKPVVGFAFLGAFSGAFGLSYFSIALVTTFTVIPMAFPPLYAIIGLSILVATWNSYTVYQTKKREAYRNTKLENRQIHLSYYEKNDKLLQDRYCRELEHYSNYQPDIIRELEVYSSATPDVTRKQITPIVSQTRQAFYNEIKFNPSSQYDLPSLVKEEELRFNDPSQLEAAIASQRACSVN